MVRIKFKTKHDQINGFYQLATKGRCRGLPNDRFEIAARCLKILDGAGIAYEIVQTEDRQAEEAEAIRNSPAEKSVYEPRVGHLVLEQSMAVVNMVGHRLVPAKHMDLK